MQKIKIALVGCGSIGKRHIAVLDADPNVDLVAICDIDESKCQTQSELYNNLPYFLDYDEMLANTNAEIISIATPHGLHAEMSIKASNAKKHVLAEKPLALHVEDCQNMIKAAEDNGVKLYVIKQNRYNVPIAMTREALDQNKMGKIFMVQCNVLWNRHQGYYDDSDWRGKKALEGGALHTQVSHFIDLMIWWFGDLVDSTGFTETFNHNIEIEDAGVVAMKFESGVIGSLIWTTCVYNKNYEGSITIIGEKGTIKIGGKYLNEIEFWDVQSHPLPEGVTFHDQPNSYGKYQGSSSNHDKVVEAVISHLLEERRDVVEGDEGMKTIQAIEQIYNSCT